MSSFESINYLLRPNKNVERKLVFSALAAISNEYNLSQYRYIGFGALWFSDFLLAHKILGIDDLISIEHAQYAKRVTSNAPLACISVLSGESTLALPKIEWCDRKALLWLDYDTGIDGPILKDLAIVAESAAEDSILIATINGHRGIIDNHIAKPKDDITNDDLLKMLQALAGDYLPQNLKPTDLIAKRLLNILGITLINRLTHALRQAGRRERFFPIFNLRHQDGVPMVTIGGIVTTNFCRAGEAARLIWQNETAPKPDKQADISIPILTAREKWAFDSCLPSSTPVTTDQLADLNVFLPARDILAYQKYYKHYPLFLELML